MSMRVVLPAFYTTCRYATLSKSTSMRWHPELIRFALDVFLTSQKAYKRLKADFKGVLNLPSGRQLQRYKGFCHSEAGLHDNIIEDMASEICPEGIQVPASRWHGGLAFDEMTHSRGLVFQKATGRLIGWTQTDLHHEAEELAALLPDDEDLVLPETTAEAMMSTHVLQVKTYRCHRRVLLLFRPAVHPT